jgi:hypothetical protein
MGLLAAARSATPWLLAATIAALAVACWAATSRRSRSTGPDPLRCALECETLAVLADVGVGPEDAAASGLGSSASGIPVVAWAIGTDLGGVPRGEALRQAARVARARAARLEGESRQLGRLVVALGLAGVAVLAYALILFLPAIDFFRSIAEASTSR